MRLLVILVCVAVATANPLKKSINAKAIEPVDQQLESKSGSNQNVDRAKKDVTFCVEVRQDKPVVVDCDDRQPIQPVPAGIQTVIPAPQPQPQPEPEPQPQPQQPGVQPIHIPHVQPHTLNIEVPCEPEIAAYVIQPPQEIVYAPTGNCFPKLPQVPNVVQVPTASGSAAPAQVLHGHGLHGHHGLHSGHGLHHTIKPAHTHTVVQPSVVQPTVVQPTVVQPTAVQPTAVHPYGIHHKPNGVECTCHSTPGAVTVAKAADEPSMTNEQLAMKFMQDLKNNADKAASNLMKLAKPAAIPMPSVQSPQTIHVTSPGSMQMPSVQLPQTIRMSVPASMTSVQSPQTIHVSAPAATATATMPMQSLSTGSGSTMRYVMPMSSLQTHMGFPQGTVMSSSGMFPQTGGQQVVFNPSMLRMKALEDSFNVGTMVQSGRPCREDTEGVAAAAAAAAAGDANAAIPAEADAKKPSATELMEQMKKKSEENSRIARFIQDEAENVVDSE